MSQKVIKGTQKLAETIRGRRLELGLTIEEAASRAGIGIKTWCRYEAGESIRNDKAKGICKALNWRVIPGGDEDDSLTFDLNEYMKHKAWSQFLCDRFGEAAAFSFVIGSDILLDHLNEDLDALSKLPRGTHVGQLSVSMTKELLPAQFLMRYDYEFLYHLKTTVDKIRESAHCRGGFQAHSVMQEIAVYLFMEESKFLMECMLPEMIDCGIRGLGMLDDWAFDLFEDMDVVTCLYSGDYLSQDHIYHFDHWADYQFHM